MATSSLPIPGTEAPNGGGLWSSIVSSIESAKNYVLSSLTPDDAIAWMRANVAEFRAAGPQIQQLQAECVTQMNRALALNRSDIAGDLESRKNWLGSLYSVWQNGIEQVNWLNNALQSIGIATLGNSDELGLLINTVPGADLFIQLTNKGFDAGSLDTSVISPTTASPLIPIAVIVTAAAIIMYVLFHRTDQARAIDATRQVIDKLAAGQITQEQANNAIQSINQATTASTSGGITGVLSNLTKYVPYIAAGILGIMLLNGRDR